MDTTEDNDKRGGTPTEEEVRRLSEHFFMVVAMDPENLSEWRRALLKARRTNGPTILDFRPDTPE